MSSLQLPKTRQCNTKGVRNTCNLSPISKFGCLSAKGVNANTTNITKCSKNIWQLLKHGQVAARHTEKRK